MSQRWILFFHLLLYTFKDENLLILRVNQIFAIRESNFVGFLLLAHNRIATIVACQLELVNSN